MKQGEAVELIRDGVAPGGTWAELGAGTGTFTRALAELLGPEGTIHAVDHSASKVRALRRIEPPRGVELHVHRADFEEALDLPDLDGVLMANALHFSSDPLDTLGRVVDHLRPGGSLLVVEYDRERANRWVPHPVPPDRFDALAGELGLGPARRVGQRPSAYHRRMYAAVARKKPVRRPG